MKTVGAVSLKIAMPEIRQNEKISHRIEGPFFIIQLINPDNLNALEGEDYIYLGELLELADKNPRCVFHNSTKQW